MEDNYEDDFLTRRALVYTINLHVRHIYLGIINNSSEGNFWTHQKVKTDYVTVILIIQNCI